jgi:ABC-type glycerol-3-phosphate transport system permease component
MLAVVIAYLTTREAVTGHRALGFLATAPVAIPGIVLGVGLFLSYTRPPLVLYGTLWVLLIALPFAVLISGVFGLMGGWSFAVAPERARRPMRRAIRADPGTAIHRGCDVDRRSHPGDCRRA